MPVRFADFTLDREQRLLTRGEVTVPLARKTFDLLDALVSERPRVLSKEQIRDRVWPKTFVSEYTLNGLVAELRTALGDDAREPRCVRTVHGFGYAFAAEALPAEPPKATAAILVFAGKTIPLYAGSNVLGRDPSSGILIDDGTVSRRHACIQLDGDQAILEDLGSKNGTFIDGVRLTEPVALANGTTFVLGDASIVFRRALSAGTTITLSG